MPSSIRNVIFRNAGLRRFGTLTCSATRASVVEWVWQAERDTAFDRSQTSRSSRHHPPLESGVTAAAVHDASRLRAPWIRASWRRWLAAAFVILHSAFVIPISFGHPADISYLRVKVERQRVELRFTFNLLTLTRFAAIDGNTDQRIDKAELDAATPALSDYLNRHIQVRINDQPASLGAPISLECIWPVPESRKPESLEADYPQRYVDIVFQQDVQPTLADIWLGFEIWKETGPLGTIEATYEQDDLRMQVPFSSGEPDYLYDTGFAVEALFQEPAASSGAPAAGESRAWIGGGFALVALAIMVAGRLHVRRARLRCHAKTHGPGFQPSNPDS